MKIVCAAICKNEEHNILGIFDNLEDFGITELYVVDTGSTDKTLELLNRASNIKVVIKSEKIEPFSFAEARNKLIDMIPCDTDFVLHLDLDERLISLPENMQLGHGYAGVRKETLYGTVSIGMHRLTPKDGWQWKQPVHEHLCFSFPVIFDKSFVIEHNQLPDKDCYENLTEFYFNETPERLYFHRLTDLIHNSRYVEYIDLFRKYGTWSLIEQHKWLAVKNYQTSLLMIKEKADKEYFDVLKLANSSSSWYYLFLCYHSVGEYETAKRYLTEALAGNFPKENEEKFFNIKIKNRALRLANERRDLYEQ